MTKNQHLQIIKSDPIYDDNQSFYQYCQYNKKSDNLSFGSKYSFLANWWFK